MRFPANLYAIENKDGKFITDHIGIGNWAKTLDQIEFWDNLSDCMNYKRHIENPKYEMGKYAPYTIVNFILDYNPRD